MSDESKYKGTIGGRLVHYLTPGYYSVQVNYRGILSFEVLEWDGTYWFTCGFEDPVNPEDIYKLGKMVAPINTFVDIGE